MNEVGIARLAQLPVVRTEAEVVRSLDELAVGGRVIRLDAMDEVSRLEHS
jgi:hypothetical protein